MISKPIVYIILLILPLYSCFKNSERAFNEAIKNYKEGKTKEVTNIEKTFIELISKDKFSEKDITAKNNLVYKIYQKRV